MAQSVDVFPTYASGLPSVYPWYGNTFGYVDKVPTMTGYTTPSGEVWASSQVPGGDWGWEAFDKNGSTMWNPDGNAIPVSLGYKFATAQAIKACSFKTQVYNGHPRIKGFTIYASNTGFTSDLVEIYSDQYPDISQELFEGFAFDNSTAYQYWIITVTSKYTERPNPKVIEMQYLG